jgi:glutamyl-tRNA synthetase
MSKNVRVRFAPSPTGPLHIGGVRTALYNYLFAKKQGGTFILRIEDTDQKRYVANAEKYIIEALNWAGIPYDEGIDKEGKFGPYRQSERKSIYKKYAQQLIDTGWAYYAFDTAEELDKERKSSETKGETFIYNWHNRETLNNSLSLTKEEVSDKISNGEKYVIRFKTPQNEILQLEDIIRGTIKINTNTLDDKVLFKSDGMPTYHLANIVDDHLMEISHVIRGEEWLPSLALHSLLYKAFGWNAPLFAHLPLLLKPVGKGKLSKRDGDKLGFPVFPLEYHNEQTGEISRGYREDGYFPEAFINMLAFLGWNPGTEQELFSLEELIQAFSLEKVSKSGAKFNLDKTKWFQQQYMQRADNKLLAENFNKIITKETQKTFDKEYIRQVVSLIKERAIFIDDLWSLGFYFFKAPLEYDIKATKKAWKEGTENIMHVLTTILEDIPDFNSNAIETVIKKWIEEKQLSFGKVLMPFRLSLVGSMQGPHVFDIAAMIGKEETISRINNAIKQLS